MKQTIAPALLTIVACLMATPGFATELLPFSKRGVFVFGRITLDFEKKVEVFAGPDTLQNCSTARFYCATAYIFNVAVPRACSEVESAKIGTEWRVGEVMTDVLAESREVRNPMDLHIPRGSGHQFLLGTSNNPSIVYTYDSALGITGLYFDASGKIDFVKMAREHRDFSPFQNLDYSFGLQTLDNFAACEN